MDNKCCNICGTLTIDGDMSAVLTIDDDVSASMGVGTVIMRDGTNDYNDLINKPSIEDITLEGNKTMEQLGVRTMTVQEIERILYLD